MMTEAGKTTLEWGKSGVSQEKLLGWGVFM